MNRKTIFTTALLLVTLSVPLSLFGQDFEMDGTVLVKYRGNAANVAIPAGVTAIGDEAFSGRCGTITLTPKGSTPGEYAFLFNGSLISVSIPSSVTAIGKYAFGWCSSLVSITVDARNNAYSSIEGVLFNKNRTILVQYPEGKRETNYFIPPGVISIGNGAFLNCDSLASISASASVTAIGDWAFAFCRNLTNVTIAEGVTAIGNWAFVECIRLTGIAIPSSVTSIGNAAFYWCESLTSITIPSSVTAIGDEAFLGCRSLRTVTLSRRTEIGEDAFPATAQITYSD